VPDGMKPINIVSLAFLVCTACSTWQRSETGGRDGAWVAGRYVVVQPDAKIGLDLRPNGYYTMRLEGWTGATKNETGTWLVKAREIVLHPESGGITDSLRRLLVVRRSGARPDLAVPERPPTAFSGLTFEPDGL
jgi:hypothetical protein